MRKALTLFALNALAFCSLQATAQERQITGKIISHKIIWVFPVRPLLSSGLQSELQLILMETSNRVPAGSKQIQISGIGLITKLLNWQLRMKWMLLDPNIQQFESGRSNGTWCTKGAKISGLCYATSKGCRHFCSERRKLHQFPSDVLPG